MRALVCHEIGSLAALSMGELPDPSPGPNQVVIDVEMAAVNFADLLVLQDLYQFRSTPPFAPGMEGVGIVSAIGEGVDGVSVGDRVAAVGFSGAFAEHWLADVHNVVPVPDDIAVADAASITIAYGTSYHALKQRAQLQPGETLLVLGAAGGVGLAAVDLGKAMGATVVAAASNDQKLAVASERGADHLVDYSSGDLRGPIKGIVGSAGVDIVYDPVGGDLAEQAFRSLGWNGRHLVVGFADGSIPSLPMNLPLLKGASLVGVFWGAFTANEPDANRENAAELYDMVRSGSIRPVVSEIVALEEAESALAAVAERRATGRILVKVA